MSAKSKSTKQFDIWRGEQRGIMMNLKKIHMSHIQTVFHPSWLYIMGKLYIAPFLIFL